MGKMEQTLKSEIARLARKQVRTTCLPLLRDVRRLRRSVSALRKTVAVLAKLGTEFQAQRTTERAKLAAVPEEVRAARLSAGLIKKLRARLGITQGELATLVGVSGSAVGAWEYEKAKPEGRNREALVALRQLGRRDVRRILAVKAAEAPQAGRGKAGPGRRAPTRRGRRAGRRSRRR